MKDFLFLMHDDAQPDRDAWPAYFERLRRADAFDGGSSVGQGVALSKRTTSRPITHHLAGYIRVRAESLDAACALVDGNPVYEAGGTVEVRELPRG